MEHNISTNDNDSVTLNSEGTLPKHSDNPPPSLRDALKVARRFVLWAHDHGASKDATDPALKMIKKALKADDDDPPFAVIEISGGIVSLAKDTDIRRVIVRDYDVEEETDTKTDPETGKPYWEYLPD